LECAGWVAGADEALGVGGVEVADLGGDAGVEAVACGEQLEQFAGFDPESYMCSIDGYNQEPENIKGVSRVRTPLGYGPAP